MQPPDVSYARSGDVAIAYGEHQLKGVAEAWRLFAVATKSVTSGQ